MPDGSCLDEQKGIWIASPPSSAVIRFEEGGTITDVIETPKNAYACMLGGRNGRTLFILTANSSAPEICRKKPEGEIFSIEVNYPRAGMP